MWVCVEVPASRRRLTGRPGSLISAQSPASPPPLPHPISQQPAEPLPPPIPSPQPPSHPQPASHRQQPAEPRPLPTLSPRSPAPLPTRPGKGGGKRRASPRSCPGRHSQLLGLGTSSGHRLGEERAAQVSGYEGRGWALLPGGRGSGGEGSEAPASCAVCWFRGCEPSSWAAVKQLVGVGGERGPGGEAHLERGLWFWEKGKGLHAPSCIWGALSLCYLQTVAPGAELGGRLGVSVDSGATQNGTCWLGERQGFGGGREGLGFPGAGIMRMSTSVFFSPSCLSSRDFF